MKTKKQKIVIGGGGFGGVKAALELSKNDNVEVTLISESKDFRYYPSIYHTATGGSRDVSSIPITELLDASSLKLVHDKIIGLDRAQNHIKTDSGKEIEYDYLVLALGVVTNYFNIPGLKEFTYGIKTLEDAEEFKIHLHNQITNQRKPDLNYVVVGGGPTGIELAGVLGDYIKYICRKHDVSPRKIHIDLVEAAPRLVPRMPKRMSKKIAKRLRNRGVKLYLNSRVGGQTADELLVNGKPIRSHTVVWTAGMTNNPFFSEQGFQLTKTGKVRVDQYLQAEPSIFVIGDNADTPYSGMAQTALYDGEYISKSINTLVNHKKPPEPYIAKKPIYVLPAGPNWAAVLWGNVKFYGRTGWALRRLADFIGYRDYEPTFKATKRWFAEYEREDLCPRCELANLN